jgi:hypothetical protein
LWVGDATTPKIDNVFEQEKVRQICWKIAEKNEAV